MANRAAYVPTISVSDALAHASRTPAVIGFAPPWKYSAIREGN